MSHEIIVTNGRMAKKSKPTPEGISRILEISQFIFIV
jgi:hypothetical protein